MSLFTLIGKWNDWTPSLIYIRDSNLYTLQFLLQRILRDVEFIKSIAQDMPNSIISSSMQKLPTESMKFALVVIAAGPMIIAFPFFQKYFASGLTIGAVKG
jgi:putative aldouronate transport system permease protein